MYEIGIPLQLSGRFHGPEGEEDEPLVIVGTVPPECVSVGVEFLKIIIVVDEIDLDSGRMHRGYLHHQRMVIVADGDADTAETDHLVKLVAAFVDIPEIGHESPHLVFLLLHGLRKATAEFRVIGSRKIRHDLLRDVNNLLLICHSCV